MNNKIQDEYEAKPRKIKPIFIRSIENLSQLQIDVRRLPWRRNQYDQIDQSLCAIPKRSSSIRFRTKTAKILEEKYNEQIKIYKDASKKTKRWVHGDNTRPKV
jgi:hypothetical protein